MKKMDKLKLKHPNTFLSNDDGQLKIVRVSTIHTFAIAVLHWKCMHQKCPLIE